MLRCEISPFAAD